MQTAPATATKSATATDIFIAAPLGNDDAAAERVATLATSQRRIVNELPTGSAWSSRRTPAPDSRTRLTEGRRQIMTQTSRGATRNRNCKFGMTRLRLRCLRRSTAEFG